MPDYYYNIGSCPYKATYETDAEAHWENPCSGCGGSHMVTR